MKSLFTSPNFKDALVRTVSNIAKLGIFAAASMFASNVFRMQATSTIQNAQSDYSNIRDLVKGI